MSDQSTLALLEAVQANDQTAATVLFERCFSELCRLVRQKMMASMSNRFDPEDVVLSAYRSFFVGLQGDRFRFEQSSDLWALLVTVTMRKLNRAHERHFAEKRDARREATLDIAVVNSSDPAIQFAELLADELTQLLSTLSPRDRIIVETRLLGQAVSDIADRAGCSEKTVLRTLKLVTDQANGANDINWGDADRVLQTLIHRTHAESESLLKNKHSFFSDDRFRLLRMIGFGGSSKVYEAIDLQQQTKVAVKFLRRPFQTDTVAVDRFLKELDDTNRIDHPGVLRFRGAGRTTAEHVFLVTDLCAGDLGRIQLPISWRRAVQYVLEAAKGLQACHAQNLLHCDLKPANLLLTADDHVIVSDFGFARQMRTGTMMDIGLRGSLPWMAPEQLDSATAEANPATDVYGLGATLFQLLTGQPPFGTGPVGELVTRILTNTLGPSAQALNSEIPQTVDKICSSMLSRDLRKRPQSMADVARLLETR